jgi:hypothetical protein
MVQRRAALGKAAAGVIFTCFAYRLIPDYSCSFCVLDPVNRGGSKSGHGSDLCAWHGDILLCRIAAFNQALL